MLLHGAGGDRSTLLPEARSLSQHGFAVLLLDWPGHGESDGEIHWGEGERVALAAALDWMSRRPEIDAGRVGAYGFSLGGYIVAQVAATDSRIRAVALAGTPSDPEEQIRQEFSRWWLLSQLPALMAVRRRGMAPERHPPKSVVSAIAPRPLLVISGTEDTTVPSWMAKELYAAARAPKEFLLLPEIGHGGYVKAAQYLDRLVSFFEKAL